MPGRDARTRAAVAKSKINAAGLRAHATSRATTRRQPLRVPKLKVGSTVVEINKMVIEFYNSSSYKVNLRSRSASSKKRGHVFTLQDSINGGKSIPTMETKEKMRIANLCVPRSKELVEAMKNNKNAALKGHKNKQQQKRPRGVSKSFSGKASLVSRE